MLDNYAVDKLGVIYQISKTEFVYDNEYVETRYGAAPVEQMSFLRVGQITAALGRIPTSVLDVGYGSGDFLKAMSSAITDVNGYDIPPAFPVPGVANVENMYSREYDLVTFFDSLEHFEDPSEIRALRTNFIHISVPWCHYFSDEWFQDWRHRRPNEHLWHFNEKSLPAFMKEMGYELICFSNGEDVIRKSSGPWQNILSATFRKL
jgi:hypothetical protein